MLNLYSFFDAAAQVYSQPFYFKMDAQAMRYFEAALEHPNSDIARFPQDFALYKMGDFNEVTGLITSCQEPIRICTATEVMHSNSKNPSNQVDAFDQKAEELSEDIANSIAKTECEFSDYHPE